MRNRNPFPHRHYSFNPGLRATFELLDEPLLLFHNNYPHQNPKTGITDAGPAGYGSDSHPEQILIGIVGTGDTQERATNWIRRCSNPIGGKPGKPRQFPDFPGVSPDHTFRTKLEIMESQSHLGRVTNTEVSNITSSRDYADGFHGAVEILGAKVRALCQSDSPPHVILVAIPDSIADYCWSAGRHLSTEEGARKVTDRFLRKIIKLEQLTGQMHLMTSLFGEQTSSGDFVGRNLRRALKAQTMKYQRPIQIALETKLLSDSPFSQDPATKAWNFAVGMYYKAGALPWRLAEFSQDTCFVGVSFYRQLHEDSFEMHSSLAQVFTSEGDAFVLRGHKFPWTEGKRSPHLTREAAGKLIELVLNKYKEFKGNFPRRVVVHKTSRYWLDELDGFRSGLTGVVEFDLLSLQHSGVRFFREGSYPPLRGTLCNINDRASFLYTLGYMPSLGTYPRPYVPEPWEILDHYGDTPVRRLCMEVLALTKMNWNNADVADSEPITTRFARKVGEILSYIPDSEEPHPSYRFYM